MSFFFLSLSLNYTLFLDHIRLSVHSNPVRRQRRCLQPVRCRKFRRSRMARPSMVFLTDQRALLWDSCVGESATIPPLSRFLFVASVATIFSFIPISIQATLFPCDSFSPEIFDSVTGPPPLSSLPLPLPLWLDLPYVYLFAVCNILLSIYVF